MLKIPVCIHTWIEPKGEQFLYPPEISADELFEITQLLGNIENNPLMRASQVQETEKGSFHYRFADKNKTAYWLLEPGGIEKRGRAFNNVKMALVEGDINSDSVFLQLQQLRIDTNELFISVNKRTAIFPKTVKNNSARNAVRNAVQKHTKLAILSVFFCIVAISLVVAYPKQKENKKTTEIAPKKNDTPPTNGEKNGFDINESAKKRISELAKESKLAEKSFSLKDFAEKFNFVFSSDDILEFSKHKGDSLNEHREEIKSFYSDYKEAKLKVTEGDKNCHLAYILYCIEKNIIEEKFGDKDIYKQILESITEKKLLWEDIWKKYCDLAEINKAINRLNESLKKDGLVLIGQAKEQVLEGKWTEELSDKVYGDIDEWLGEYQKFTEEHNLKEGIFSEEIKKLNEKQNQYREYENKKIKVRLKTTFIESMLYTSETKSGIGYNINFIDKKKFSCSVEDFQGKKTELFSLGGGTGSIKLEKIRKPTENNNQYVEFDTEDYNSFIISFFGKQDKTIKFVIPKFLLFKLKKITFDKSIIKNHKNPEAIRDIFNKISFSIERVKQ